MVNMNVFNLPQEICYYFSVTGVIEDKAQTKFKEIIPNSKLYNAIDI